MPDLTTLRAGDSVHFRCGGAAVVDMVMKHNEHNYDYDIQFHAVDKIAGYTKEGFWNFSEHAHPFDIIRIEPKPFDWKDVKPGMAFLTKAGYVRIFECWSVFPNSKGEKVAICTASQKINDQIAERENPEHLTRAPEHDIEAQS